MVIGINEKDLAFARFIRIRQEQDDLDRQIKAAMALSNEALELGDEKKAERYTKMAFDLLVKHMDLTGELLEIALKQ